MADIVDRHQVLRCIVGLEMADPRVLGRFLKQGLVTVGKVCAAVGQRLAHAVDCVGGQHIIVVSQRQILAGGQLGGGVGVGGNALVFNFGVDNAGILRGAGLHSLAHIGVGGIAGVHQHKLPVGGGLCLHAVEKLIQKLRRRIVQRRQNTDGWPAVGVLRGVGPLGLQSLLGGQIPCFFAEEPPLEKSGGPPGHHADALFLCQGPRIAEQFFDAFCLKAHGVAPHKSNLCASFGGLCRCTAKSVRTRARCAQRGHERIFARWGSQSLS